MQGGARNSAVLKGIMDASIDAVIVSDAQGKILQANAAASRVFQYETNEMLGQSVNMLMPPSVADKHDNFMHHYKVTREKRIVDTSRDVEGQRKDKSVFPLHLSVAESTVDDEKLFIGIFHDLSQRRATQDALARSQRLEAIGQMTGGIAHDFNNLLTVVIGNLELLQQRGTEDRHLPLIEDALSAAELGAELTSRLMVFARKSSLKPVRTDLKALCDDTLAILRRTLGSNYTIRTDFATDLNAIMIDPVQLQAALVNLALNARDAMRERGELLISAANVAIDDTYVAQETDIVPGKYVRLSVIDNGAGRTINTQKRAFEPFFTTKSDGGGTGLGLAMVYGFVRQSGGHITLYSEVGLGTSFGLYFPAVSEADDAAADHQLTKISIDVGRGAIVLVVEDNPKVRKLSIERVRDLGFATHEAATGDEAYRMLEEGLKVDIVFSDLVMPGTLNGYDLATKIEKNFPQVKVLLTSGYASDAVTNSMAEGQTYSILHKPYRQSELMSRLQALIEGGSED